MHDGGFFVAVVGNGDEAMIAAEAVRACGAIPIMFVSDSPNTIPFSLIRGSWIGRSLPLPLHADSGEDTTDTWGHMFKEWFTENGSFVYNLDAMSSLATALMMYRGNSIDAVVVATPLPLLCQDGNNHNFSSITYWEMITKAVEKAKDAIFIENDDFKNYPWCVMVTIEDVVVRIYPRKPPLSGSYPVYLPVETDCNCISSIQEKGENVFAIGPSANWNGRMHRNKIFEETTNAIKPLVDLPRLF